MSSNLGYKVPEFSNWLGFANAGMLSPENIPCMEVGAAYMPGGAIVEVGSFCGLSTNLIGYFNQKHKKAPFFTCDRWVFEGSNQGTIDPHTTVTHPEYRNFVKETFIRNVQFFSKGHPPHTIELFSDEFFPAWRERREMVDVFMQKVQLGGPIGFAFIDGNHQYEFAKRDFQNVDEFLLPGGFILFDDSADGSPWPVNQLVREVHAAGRYELISKSPHYFFKKK